MFSLIQGIDTGNIITIILCNPSGEGAKYNGTLYYTTNLFLDLSSWLLVVWLICFYYLLLTQTTAVHWNKLITIANKTSLIQECLLNRVAKSPCALSQLFILLLLSIWACARHMWFLLLTSSRLTKSLFTSFWDYYDSVMSSLILFLALVFNTSRI